MKSIWPLKQEGGGAYHFIFSFYCFLYLITYSIIQGDIMAEWDFYTLGSRRIIPSGWRKSSPGVPDRNQYASLFPRVRSVQAYINSSGIQRISAQYYGHWKHWLTALRDLLSLKSLVNKTGNCLPRPKPWNRTTEALSEVRSSKSSSFSEQ